MTSSEVFDFIAGPIILFIGILFLWFVERSTVEYYLMLKRCERVTKSVLVDSIESKNNNLPVFFRGGLSVHGNSGKLYDKDVGYAS